MANLPSFSAFNDPTLWSSMTKSSTPKPQVPQQPQPSAFTPEYLPAQQPSQDAGSMYARAASPSMYGTPARPQTKPQWNQQRVDAVEQQQQQQALDEWFMHHARNLYRIVSRDTDSKVGDVCEPLRLQLNDLQRKIWIGGMGLAAILLVAVVAAIVQQRKKRKKKKAASAAPSSFDEVVLTGMAM